MGGQFTGIGDRTVKILIDMNLPPKLADLLIQRKIDAVHWCKIGAPDAKDTEIMEYANKNNYIIMTCDLDFNILLSITRRVKPSIVQLRTQRFEIEKDGEWLASVILRNAAELAKGAILSVDTKKSKLRLLPL